MITMTQNVAGRCLCNMRIQLNLRHNVQFYRLGRFSVDSRKRIKTVVRTQIDQGLFDYNENAYF